MISHSLSSPNVPFPSFMIVSSARLFLTTDLCTAYDAHMSCCLEQVLLQVLACLLLHEKVDITLFCPSLGFHSCETFLPITFWTAVPFILDHLALLRSIPKVRYILITLPVITFYRLCSLFVAVFFSCFLHWYRKGVTKRNSLFNGL